MQSTFLVADIFGKTAALTALSQGLDNAEIVDPYDGKMMNFSDEADAYKYFSEHIGLARYVEALSQAVANFATANSSISLGESNVSNNLRLVGFSAGASAIWHFAVSGAAESSMGFTFNGICFYGSQIRNSIEKSPRFPIELIFPREESHFDVDTLIKSLRDKEKTKIEKVDYLHGFMNKCSANFKEEAYAFYLQALKTKP